MTITATLLVRVPFFDVTSGKPLLSAPLRSKSPNDIAKSENEDALAKVRATGKTQIIALTKEEKNAWKKALMKVHRESEATIGKGLIQEIYKETGFDPAKL